MCRLWSKCSAGPCAVQGDNPEQQAACKVLLSSVTQSCRLSATPWTVARQAPLSMGFPRQEYWSGQPLHSPGAGVFPTQGSNPRLLHLLHYRQILYH